MISIVICSRHSSISNELLQNINSTISVPYELIVIDNSKNNHNLFSAYNEGWKRSQYSIICFMHDDIIYHSIGWGKTCINHFLEKNVGMIGTVGTSYLSEIPSPWWAGGIKLIHTGSDIIYQNNIDTDKNTLINRNQPVINPYNELKSEVVVLDGLWFCIRKDLFSEISFDEKLFGGFHFYDLDISLQIKMKGYKVFVIYDLVIEHISDSKYDKKWIFSCIRFYKKWKNNLPISNHIIDNKTKIYINYESSRIFLNIVKSNNLFIVALKLPLATFKIFYSYFTNKFIYSKLNKIK